MSELTVEALKNDIFYSPTREEPYSIRRETIDRSAGILAARAYLENRRIGYSRSVLNTVARVITWMGRL